MIGPREVLWGARVYQPRWQVTALMYPGLPVRSHLRTALLSARDKNSAAEYVQLRTKKERVWLVCHNWESMPPEATTQRKTQLRHRLTVLVDHGGWVGIRLRGP